MCKLLTFTVRCLKTGVRGIGFDARPLFS